MRHFSPYRFQGLSGRLSRRILNSIQNSSVMTFWELNLLNQNAHNGQFDRLSLTSIKSESTVKLRDSNMSLVRSILQNVLNI